MPRKPDRATHALLQRLLRGYPAEAARLLEGLPPEVAAPLLATLEPTRSAIVLARAEGAVRTAILARLEAGLRREVEELLAYPPDSAGRLMDPRAAGLRPELTVKEALARLRRLRRGAIHEIFLVDEAGRLAGAVSLQALALAEPAESLAALSRGRPEGVQALATREEVVERLTQRGLTSLPVLDAEERLLGLIRHEALVDAVREEVSLDIQTMVGASKEERALSPALFAVRKRLPWLEINLLTAFLAAAVMGLFEETIARFTALAVLLPVVAGQSGNTGAQALAVTMRGLALREIRLRHWPAVSLKEVTVASVNGVAVTLTTALGVYLWSRSAGLALVIGVSMVISMAAAGLFGAVIPMLLVALRQDPAQSSSIILTTVTDVVGFFSFLGIATLLAGML